MEASSSRGRLASAQKRLLVALLVSPCAGCLALGYESAAGELVLVGAVLAQHTEDGGAREFSWWVPGVVIQWGGIGGGVSLGWLSERRRYPEDLHPQTPDEFLGAALEPLPRAGPPTRSWRAFFLRVPADATTTTRTVLGAQVVASRHRAGVGAGVLQESSLRPPEHGLLRLSRDPGRRSQRVRWPSPAPGP
ncbi:MAG: hypothetical protein GC161_10430 [Planctomycetaceae bacterium]|nr:hypothetical protein [Planctomycetaceae bacterium]